MHIYQMIMVAGAWLSVNFIMKINREKEEKQKFIDEVKKGVKEAVKVVANQPFNVDAAKKEVKGDA